MTLPRSMRLLIQWLRPRRKVLGHMRRISPIFFLGVMLVLTGCKTSRVFHRPLNEVRRAVQDAQPEMARQFSQERRTFVMNTNEIAGETYLVHIRDPMVSSPWFPYLTVEVRRVEDFKTKVTVTRRGADDGRGRDLEGYWLEVVAAKLKTVQ